MRPGTDAWCLAGLLGTPVQEDLLDHAFLTTASHGGTSTLQGGRP
ncbi:MULTISPECIES: hypothetical protein [unclassified Streptomyces]|nr:hypothetical protein [Streptomyces sp. TSRI0107]